eukprot:Amastigsp_a509022_512.p5 type:complete len:116 gc:universal Amastigsp_a509022_512:640-987(+)
MLWCANPRMPSNLATTNVMPGSFVASANVCCEMSRPPIDMSSVERNPVRDPVPYWIANEVPFAVYVFDDAWLYFLWRSHATSVSLQVDDGTQRFDEPVSKQVVNDCGGVPMVMGP